MTKTIELNQEQAEFLATAMEWWKTSGVNVWSARSAQEILDKVQA
jgi:hypothetical protein